MNKKSTTKKKKLAILLLKLGFLVLAVLCGIMPLEYGIKHFILPGSLDITETEPSWNEEEGDGQNMYRGYTVTKDPTIANVTDGKDSSAYVRAIMTITDKETGKTITDLERLALIEQTIKYDSNDFFPEGKTNSYSSLQIAFTNMYNNTDWEVDIARTTAAGAGVYYFNYKTEMDSNEKSELFNRIIIPNDWNKEQINKLGDYEIKLDAQAVRGKPFDNQKEAMVVLDFIECGKGSIVPCYIIFAGVIVVYVVSQKEEKRKNKIYEYKKEIISFAEEHPETDIQVISGESIPQMEACSFKHLDAYELEMGRTTKQLIQENEIKGNLEGKNYELFSEQEEAA